MSFLSSAVHDVSIVLTRHSLHFCSCTGDVIHAVQGRTPLHQALWTASTAVIIEIVKSGANLEAVDSLVTAVQYFCRD